MIKRISILSCLVLILVASFVSPTYAHPGNTAADGCHYCRTNCDKWGVPWNERHCHGGAAVAPIVEQPKPIVVTNSPVPVKVVKKVSPTRKPTRKPTKKPTKSPTPTKKNHKTQK